MFKINEDLSIYITRGDSALFTVTAAENGGQPHLFQPGDVVRMTVTERKNCVNVVMQKDFPVEEELESVLIYLEEKDTKIGDTISKPVDYWYEIELNPFTDPQTIIGYDENGAKVFRLFPEGHDLPPDIDEEDIPVVDADFSLTSQRPIQNQAVTRALIGFARIIESGGEIPPELHFEVMRGATDTEDGSGGITPPPLAGQQDHVLHGDGTWRKGGVDKQELTEFVDKAIAEAKENGDLDVDPGIYIGSDAPPDNASVWIDPSGDPSGTEDWEFDMEDGTTETKTVVVV